MGRKIKNKNESVEQECPPQPSTCAVPGGDDRPYSVSGIKKPQALYRNPARLLGQDPSSEWFADPVVGEGRVLDGGLDFRHVTGCTVLRAYGAGRAWVIR